MNDTTAASSYTDTTNTYPASYYYSLLVNPVIVVRIYLIAYPITFLLGFVGNTASLITFSRSTLRKVSTGCLFIILAASDTLYLFMCIFDFVEFGLQVRLYGRIKYDEICRFRTFIMDVSQVLSSWVPVTISFDRWIRTRFPYKSSFLCTPKKALIVVGVLLILDIGLHAEILSPLFGGLIPGFANAACGPLLIYQSYLSFYVYHWSVIQIVVVCLAPVIIMLLILIDIFISVRIRKRAVIQPAQVQVGTNRGNQQRNLQLQMFILMLTSTCIFLVTTLPLAIYRITSPREENFVMDILEVTTVWTGLGWFQSLNYAINFYSHCLTSTLFRKEFRLLMKFKCCVRETPIQAFTITKTEHRTQASRR